MRNERKIEALKEATDRKRHEALEKTNAAIERLLKEGKRINFPSVAKEAGVSVTYLYKIDEIKSRILHLRKQQALSIENPVTPQSASDKSKQVIINQLRERIRQLEANNRELRDKNEAVYGRLYQLQGVQQERESLKLEVGSLKAENNWLKLQLDEYRRAANIHSCSTLSVNSRITSLEQKRTQQKDISDKIKSELAAVGVKLNTTLTKTIKSSPEEIVLLAIQALKQALEYGNVERPGGWLNSAIQNGWMPNEKNLPQDKVERDIFKQWFDLAYKQRLVLASTKGDDGRMYVFTVDGLRISFEQMLAEYPLEKLQPSL